jgi:hypothetical protein
MVRSQKVIAELRAHERAATSFAGEASRTIAMVDRQPEIERAIHNDLTPEDRAVLERARELNRERAKGRDLNEWLDIDGKAHNVRIKLARRLAGSPNRNGSKYNGYLHDIMQHDGIDTKDRKKMGNLTAVAWLVDEEYPDRLELLAEARAQMSPRELAALNSPHSARKLVKKLLDERSGYEPAPKPASSIAKLAEENAELKRANAHLEEQLASKDDANTVFTPKDSAKDIVASIAPTLSREKLREIEKAIPVWLKEHPVRKPKPPKMK